jgi:hypothetical protein
MDSELGLLGCVAVHLLLLQGQAVQHGLQFRLLALGHRLGGHLHVQGAAVRTDGRVDGRVDKDGWIRM